MVTMAPPPATPAHAPSAGGGSAAAPLPLLGAWGACGAGRLATDCRARRDEQGRLHRHAGVVDRRSRGHELSTDRLHREWRGVLMGNDAQHTATTTMPARKTTASRPKYSPAIDSSPSLVGVSIPPPVRRSNATRDAAAWSNRPPGVGRRGRAWLGRPSVWPVKGQRSRWRRWRASTRERCATGRRGLAPATSHWTRGPRFRKAASGVDVDSRPSRFTARGGCQVGHAARAGGHCGRGGIAPNLPTTRAYRCDNTLPVQAPERGSDVDGSDAYLVTGGARYGTR
jgi:hypothetical protein